MACFSCVALARGIHAGISCVSGWAKHGVTSQISRRRMQAQLLNAKYAEISLLLIEGARLSKGDAPEATCLC
jgi:hypothetical protein